MMKQAEQERAERNKLIAIHIDPLREYTDVSKTKLLEACGFLPAWVTSQVHLHLTLQEALDAQYCCGLFEMDGSVSPEGLFTYPGDPDLHPFIKINRGEETFYQYRNAIGAIINEKGKTYITRMD